MQELSIEFQECEGGGFEPGAMLRGTAAWRCDREPQRAELVLLWYTQGRGTMDSAVAARSELPSPKRQEQRPFSFELPHAPYSFSGTLISLIWAVELILDPGGTERRTFVLAPGGSEIRLPEGVEL